MLKFLRYCGFDWFGVYLFDKVILVYECFVIVGVLSGV